MSMGSVGEQNSLREMPAATAMRIFFEMLGHKDFGVTELRVFDPPRVAYADNVDSFVSLCLAMDDKVSGMFAGVQPRAPDLYDLAPNRWVPARGGPRGNCSRSSQVEYLANAFFDIDVVSEGRTKGHPASDEELERSLQAAELLRRQEGLAESSTICCSGNGHYVLAPFVPISVGGEEIARKFRCFCQQLAANVAGQVEGVRVDATHDLARVMRVPGSTNRKGEALPDRPHRRAYFVTEPILARSLALHYMILNTEAGPAMQSQEHLPAGLRCDLSKIEGCEFIQWSRAYPQDVSQSAWWAMITNLVHLEGGIQLIYEISRLDRYRFDYADTQRIIHRVIDAGYRPVSCKTIVSDTATCLGRGRFQCSRINKCPAKAPMYLATNRTVYPR